MENKNIVFDNNIIEQFVQDAKNDLEKYKKKKEEYFLILDKRDKERQKTEEEIDESEHNKIIQDYENMQKNINSFFTNKNSIFYQDKFSSILNDIRQNIQKEEDFEIDINSPEFHEAVYDACTSFSFKKIKNYYEELLKSVHQEIKKRILLNIIFIPLPLSLNFENKINVSKNIEIQFFSRYQFDKIDATEKDNQTELEKYFKAYMQEKLNQNNFDKTSYTILAVSIQNLPSKVKQEVLRIVEAIYSFIRIFGFISEDWLKIKFGEDSNISEEDEKLNTWLYENRNSEIVTRNKIPKCNINTSYVVYNQQESSPKDKKIFSYRFEPLLDRNEKTFETYIDKFKLLDLLQNYISYCFNDKEYSHTALDKNYEDFIKKRQKYDKQLSGIQKWQNTIILFNTAYELASNEKYDIALILLLSILESLFIEPQKEKKILKTIELSRIYFGFTEEQIKDLLLQLEAIFAQKGSKKDKIKDKVNNFLYNEKIKKVENDTVTKLLEEIDTLWKNSTSKKRDPLIKELKTFFAKQYRFDNKKIENYIKKMYKKRNDYVHEGISSYLQFYPKCNFDLQREIEGLRPFHYNQLISYEEQDLFHLFNLVGFILILFLDGNIFNTTKKE